MRLVILLVLILASSFVMSTEYQIDFTQVENDLVVIEKINGTQISSYVDREVVERGVDGFVILEKISFEKNFSLVTILVHLDEGFMIGENGAYPENYVAETDGRTISLTWNWTNVSAGESKAIFLNLSSGENSSNILFFSILILFLVGFTYLIINTFFKKRKKNELDKYLLDSERAILDELKKADRYELWQKNIQIKLNLSKAKTSRIIRNLESRNLIEKIPFGNTNKIRLR